MAKFRRDEVVLVGWIYYTMLITCAVLVTACVAVILTDG